MSLERYMYAKDRITGKRWRFVTMEIERRRYGLPKDLVAAVVLPLG